MSLLFRFSTVDQDQTCSSICAGKFDKNIEIFENSVHGVSFSCLTSGGIRQLEEKNNFHNKVWLEVLALIYGICRISNPEQLAPVFCQVYPKQSNLKNHRVKH